MSEIISRLILLCVDENRLAHTFRPIKMFSIGRTFDGKISEDKEEQAKRVLRFHDGMNCCQKEFRKILALTTAQVPILRFKHVGTGLHCDLSFRSGMAVKNSELIK